MDSRLQMVSTVIIIGTVMAIPLAMSLAFKKQDEDRKRERE